MSYFEDHYGELRYPIAKDDDPGLRRAQLGALHGIGAFYSLPQVEAGLVVMPTGSGKTAVIAMSPFLLRATRVLILTPSQLVRTQITEQMASLSVIKRAKVLDEACANPKVKEVKGRLSTVEAWEELREFDIAVATPQCVSPGMEGVAEPPADLFDLIMMDEAHHSEAPRWSDILKYFRDSKRLLFTATPFRRDKRELKARMIYNYPLRLAHSDKIFGNLKFVAVDPAHGESHDEAIAKKAAAIFDEDKNAGLEHRLMVRTDSKKRAEDLAEVYKKHTKLKLAVVHSGHVMSTIRKVLARLKSGELDGIICVAMMGEGFDFPALKIAAVHTPHKSLAVTLQFIGRFARTGGEKLGEAKFIAIPQDIKAETDELYRESAAWQDIVANLSATRIEQEVKIKQVADSFAPIAMEAGDIEDVVVTDFRPFFHVKIYELPDAPDLATLPEFPKGVTVLRHEISEEYNGSILLMKQVTRPRWTDHDQFQKVDHDLVVLYFDPDTNLLFINSSRRSLMFYKLFEDYYGKGAASLLSGPKINRVIADLSQPEFFSIGLKNIVQNSNTESYQIKSGPSAQNAISATDGQLYQRGHLMGTGADEEGKRVTIGFSSSSKVWSNFSGRIGELIEWCKLLATKLSKEGEVVTGTPLDNLRVGEELQALPDGVIGVGWPEDVFKDFPNATIETGDGSFECCLLDCELSFDRNESTAQQWVFKIEHDTGANISLGFEIAAGRPVFTFLQGNAEFSVIQSGENVPMVDYLKHYPVGFFLEDFSRVDGATLHRYNFGGQLFLPEHCRTLAWQQNGVDIEVECADALDLQAPKTIQDFLGVTLQNGNADIVFFDHGSGEMADFITLKNLGNERVMVELYHCKGSGGPDPGDRVGDAYEVCGQVSKCLIWLKNKNQLRTKILEREHDRPGKSYFLKGTRNSVLQMLDDDVKVKLEFCIHVVQPGIAVNNISQKIGRVLGAASHYVQRSCDARMYLIGSA